MKSALELGAFIVFSVFLLRPFKKTVLLSRMPFFLESLGILLVLGVGDLASTLSPNSPLVSDAATRNYLLVIAALMVVGIAWAVVNLCLRRAVVLNVLALVVSIGWATLFLLALGGTFIWYL